MDGNGRWAQQRRLPRVQGHRAGLDVLQAVVEHLQGRGLRYVTCYAFSTENWSRPAEEVSFLMSLLKRYVTREVRQLVEKGFRLEVLGDLSALAPDVREAVESACAASRSNDGLQINLALSYGGQQELTRAARTLAQQVADGARTAESIDEAAMASVLYQPDVPPPDLILRTSGEQRLSNFLLWQSAYAELAFTKTLWPDFTTGELDAILADYSTRDRRFGGLSQAEVKA